MYTRVSRVHNILINLFLDGQIPYKLTSSPLLLNLSELILTYLCDKQSEVLLVTHWMLLRLLFTKQQLFSNQSPTIWNQIQSIQTKYYEKLLLFVRDYFELQCELKIELALCCLYYFEYNNCKSILNSVQDELCFDLKVTGEMGKRTKFQIDEKAQLVLMILKKKDIPQLYYHFPIESYKEKIKNVELEDDTLLDYVQVCNY